MRPLYARVFVQILDSSLAENWQARHVFEDFLKLADEGMVDMTRQAISRRTNVPLDVLNAAIEVLECPDPASRDAAEEGRRIARLDEHRDWGWRIVNWAKYERIKRLDDQRAQTRERVRKFREKGNAKPLPSGLPSPEQSENERERESYKMLHAVTASSDVDGHKEKSNARKLASSLPSQARIWNERMGEKFSRVLAWSPKRERMLAARRREPIWHEKYETEVGIDRRTVARVINERNVPAAGEAKGAPVYKLRDFLDGWRAEIADKAALPEQKELWDLLSEAMRTIKMFHDAHKC